MVHSNESYLKDNRGMTRQVTDIKVYNMQLGKLAAQQD